MPEIEDDAFGANSTPTAKSQAAFPTQSENPGFSDETAIAGDAGRWVVFEYCISLIAVTLRRTSRPIYLRPDQRGWVRGLPYVVISLVFGWWGLPWGIIYTPITVFANLTGGCDITGQVWHAAPSRA